MPDRRPFARPLTLLLCLAVCLCTCGCVARRTATALTVLLDILASQASLPAGDVYLLSDSPSLRALGITDTQRQPVRVADAALLSAVFGKGGGTSVPDVLKISVDDGAMRFATAASPFELIVLHCVSRADADKVATLLHERLDILRREYPDGEGVLERAEVVVVGKYAMLLVCRDTEAALRAVHR